MRRSVTLIFLAVQGVLYATLFALDLLRIPGPGVWLKYIGILLCLTFSLLCLRSGGDGMVFPALTLTALVDVLLLLTDSLDPLGVFLFLGAQTVYLIRLRLTSGKSRWLLRATLPLLIGAVMVEVGLGTPLNLLAGLYFSQLVVNTLLAWTTPGQRLFAIGLTLFVCCDLCVAAFNAPGLVPGGLYHFARVGMWLFYLPSQVLIALSALPKKGT